MKSKIRSNLKIILISFEFSIFIGISEIITQNQ